MSEKVKIEAGETVMWRAWKGWCKLYVLEGVNEEGRFTAEIVDSSGYKSHIGEIYYDWQADYVQ